MSNWEKKCKRCGMCCHDKVLLADALVVLPTACKFLGPDNRCTVYKTRFKMAPWCVKLTPKLVKKVKWLPEDCGLK